MYILICHIHINFQPCRMNPLDLQKNALIYIPNSIAGSVCSSGDPSTKKATHTTSVPLYSGRAVIVRVLTRLPLTSRVVPGVMSRGGSCPNSEPFTLQSMKEAVG